MDKYDKLVYIGSDGNKYYFVHVNGNKYRIHHYGRCNNEISRHEINFEEIEESFAEDPPRRKTIKWLKGKTFCNECKHGFI